MNILIYFVLCNPVSHEHVSLNKSTPPSQHVHPSGGGGSRGGVVAMYNSVLLINPKLKLNYKSFDSLIFILSHPA